MANCEDIKDKNSQEYKDCVEKNKKNNDLTITTKPDGTQTAATTGAQLDSTQTPATIGSVGKLEGVDAVGQVSDASRFRNTLGIKLGTELVNEVTTRNTTNSWTPTVENMFKLEGGDGVTVEDKYKKLKTTNISYLEKDNPELYKEYRKILESTPGYEPRVESPFTASNEKFQEIRKNAKNEFNLFLETKKEDELKLALGDKVFAIYKEAGYDPTKISEESLLNPETFSEEEINNNKILINKGLNEYKQRLADSIIDNFRKDNDISGVGGQNELSYNEIIRGTESWFFGEGDFSPEGKYPNQAILDKNIKLARKKAAEKNIPAQDEIRRMIRGDADYLKSQGYEAFTTPQSISNDIGDAVKAIEDGRKQIEKEGEVIRKQSQVFNKKIQEIVDKRDEYLKFYGGAENQKIIKGLGLEYNPAIANKQLQDYTKQINELVTSYNAENFDDQIIALNLRNDVFNRKAKALQEKAEKFDDFTAIMGAAAMNHNLIDKTIANFERDYIGSPYTLWTQAKGLGFDLLAATSGMSMKSEEAEEYFKEQANLVRTAGINYYTFLQDKQEKFVKGPTIDEVKNDDDFYFSSGTMFKNWTADAALTISAVLGPSKVASLVSKGLIKNLTKQTLKGASGKLVAADISKSAMTMANRTTMGIFFTSSAGSQLGQTEFTRSIADKKIKLIEKSLENENLSFIEKQNLLNELNTYTDSKNNSRAFRIFNSIGYGLVEMYAEKFGTLRYMNDFNAAKTIAERAGKLNLWQKGLYGTYSFGKNIATEIVEETITEIAHVGLDNFGRDKKISMFTGLDKDFFGNVAYTSMLLQGPTRITNIWNTLKQEIITKEDRAATEKIFGRLYDIQSDLDAYTLDPTKFTKKEVQDLKNERDNLFQVGSINEFLSMQKWTKMSKLERDKLIDLGGKLKTVEAAYVKFIQDPAFGVEGFQDQVQEFENQINELREQQGVLLQSKSFKDFQAWQKQDIKDGGTGQRVSDVVAFGRNQVFEAATDILKHQTNNNVDLLRIEDITDFVNKQKNLNQKQKDALAGSYAGVLNGKAYINMDLVYAALSSGSTSEALIAAISPLHELIHLQIAKKKIFGRNPELTKKAEIASSGLLNIIDSKVKKGQLTLEKAKQIKDRINNYKKDGELNFEEINTIFGEAIILGNIKQSDFAGLSGMKEFLNGMFSMMNPGGASEILNPFNSGADMYNFLSNFVDKQADVSTRIVTADTEKEGLETSSPTLVPVPGDLKSQFDNEFVIQGDTYSTKLENEDGERKFNSKEDFKNSVEKTNLQMLIELTPTLDASIRNLPGVSQAYLDMPGNETYVEDVKKRISDKAMSEFNPALNESFFGWLTGKNVSGKSIIELAAGDIQIKNKKKVSTTSIDSSTRQIADPGSNTNTDSTTDITPIIDVMKFAKKADPSIDVKTFEQDFNKGVEKLAKEKGIDITNPNLTSKQLQEITPYDVLAKAIGIPANKLSNPKDNLSKAESLKAQRLLLTAKPFIKNVVLGQANKQTQTVPSLKPGGKPVKVGGETLGLGRNILNKFFNPPKRVGNNYVRTPKEFNNKVYEASIGVKDGKVDPNYVPRAAESQIIKGLLKGVAEQMANKGARNLLKTKEQTSEVVKSKANLERGKNELVFSTPTNPKITAQLQNFSNSLRTVNLNKIFRDAGFKLEKVQYPSSDKSIANRASSGKFFKVDKKTGEYLIDENTTDQDLIDMYISEDTVFVKDETFLEARENFIKKIAPFLNPSILEASLLAGGPRSMYNNISEVYKDLGVTTKAQAAKFFNNNAPVAPKNFDYSRGKFAKMSRSDFRKYTKTDEFKNNEALKMPFLKDFANVIAKTMKNDKEAKALWAGFLGATSNMSKGIIRRMAPIKFWSLINQKKGNLFVEEHSMPANNIAKFIFYIAEKDAVEKNFSFIEDNYFQGQLRKLDDNN